MYKSFALLLLCEAVLGLQLQLTPGRQLCVQKEPNLDFDLLVDVVLSSDNAKAVMDVKLSSMGMLLNDQ